jgi:hypothetical protein
MIRRYVAEYNREKSLHRQIGVQEFNNTKADDLAALENLDCMWLHIFSWGKTAVQQAVRTVIRDEGLEAAKNHRQSEIRKGASVFPSEWKVNINEKAIALDRYQLGLGPKDNDSHRPLLVFVSEQAMANKRDRTKYSQYYRTLAYQTKESVENMDLRWSQARQAISAQRQIDAEKGWQHPHTKVQYKREHSSVPYERQSTARGSNDPDPASGGTGDTSDLRSKRTRSRPRSPDRWNDRGSWNWSNSSWWWTTGWAQTQWGARGQDPNTSEVNETVSWLTVLMIIVGTICVLNTVYRCFGKLGHMFLKLISRLNGSPQTIDQSVQVGNCSHAMQHVFTTAQGECVHLFPHCSTLTANRTTVVQERTLCSICSSQFDQHYSSSHPEATFCRVCKMWLENDTAYINHLSSPTHRNSNAARQRRR